MQMMIINDVQQHLPAHIFKNGPWLHLATVMTPVTNVAGRTIPQREFICFKHVPSNQVYIELLDLTSPTVFQKIESPSMFEDIKNFLTDKGILSIGVGEEFKFAKN